MILSFSIYFDYFSTLLAWASTKANYVCRRARETFSYENSKLCSEFKTFPISKANHSIPKVGYFYALKYSNSKGCVHECESSEIEREDIRYPCL